MLQEQACDVVRQIPSGSVIVELGCGTATKTAILLQALLKRWVPSSSVPAPSKGSHSFTVQPL